MERDALRWGSMTTDPLVPFHTSRLSAEPLRPTHAPEAFEFLDDPELHRHIGGAPLSLEALSARYRRLSTGAPAGSAEVWGNWLLREDTSGKLVGTVQATITPATGSAMIAWVVGTRFQRRGFATEAARGLVATLRAGGIPDLAASIHPDNIGSQGVARALSFSPTGVFDDGEEIWRA